MISVLSFALFQISPGGLEKLSEQTAHFSGETDAVWYFDELVPRDLDQSDRPCLGYLARPANPWLRPPLAQIALYTFVDGHELSNARDRKQHVVCLHHILSSITYCPQQQDRLHIPPHTIKGFLAVQLCSIKQVIYQKHHFVQAKPLLILLELSAPDRVTFCFPLSHPTVICDLNEQLMAIPVEHERQLGWLACHGRVSAMTPVSWEHGGQLLSKSIKCPLAQI